MEGSISVPQAQVANQKREKKNNKNYNNILENVNMMNNYFLFIEFYLLTSTEHI